MRATHCCTTVQISRRLSESPRHLTSIGLLRLIVISHFAKLPLLIIPRGHYYTPNQAPPFNVGWLDLHSTRSHWYLKYTPIPSPRHAVPRTPRWSRRVRLKPDHQNSTLVHSNEQNPPQLYVRHPQNPGNKEATRGFTRHGCIIASARFRPRAI